MKLTDNIRFYIPSLGLLLAAAPFAAQAQDALSKEITIEREIVPQVKAVNRPTVYPSLLSYPRESADLSFSDTREASEIAPLFSLFEPAHPTAIYPAPSPWRGYVDAGYFPSANVGISAGYTLVERENTRFNIFGQFNNKAYKGAPEASMEKLSFHSMDYDLGLRFFHRFTDHGNIMVKFGFGGSSFAQPYWMANPQLFDSFFKKNQGIGRLNLSARWDGFTSGDVRYYVGAGVATFGYSKDVNDTHTWLSYPVLTPSQELPEYVAVAQELSANPATAVKETDINLQAGLNKAAGSAARIGIDLDATFQHFNCFRTVDEDFNIFMPDAEGVSGSAAPDATAPADVPSGKTLGLVSLTPYYRMQTPTVDLKIGARIDFSINSGKGLHVAPDIILGINPAAGFGASLKLRGGERLNTLQSLWNANPYNSGVFAYKFSNIPLLADLDLRLGPVQGASLNLKLAYGMANDWLLPSACNYYVFFNRQDLRAWKAGAELNYSFRSLLAVKVGFEALLGDKNDAKTSWMEWRDRARQVLSAGVTVTPVENLQIDAEYQLRTRRSMPFLNTLEGMGEDGTPMFSNADLKDLNCLNLGASYRFTPRFTVFARVENLLASGWKIAPLIPEQGFTGLVGIGFKF